MGVDIDLRCGGDIEGNEHKCALRLKDMFEEVFSKKYKYIHYYDIKDTRTSKHAWREGRIDHNLQKEKDYLNYLIEQKKVVELAEE